MFASWSLFVAKASVVKIENQWLHQWALPYLQFISIERKAHQTAVIYSA